MSDMTNVELQGLVTTITAVLGVVGTLVGAGWVLFQYRHQQKESARVRRIEAAKPFLEMQLKLYTDAAKTVGELVSLQAHSTDWNAARRHFEALYWSELSIVENAGVEHGMKRFRDILLQYEQDQRPATIFGLNTAAYFLAHEIRDSIQEGWRGLESTKEPQGRDSEKDNAYWQEVKLKAEARLKEIGKIGAQ